jgi:Fic family protein
MHTKLVFNHPFNDGNGRTARLLMNACLLAAGLPVLVVNYADKERYLHCLSESNKGDLSALTDFMLDCFEQQMSNLISPKTSLSEELAAVTSLASVPVDADPLVAVLEAAGAVEPEDP